MVYRAMPNVPSERRPENTVIPRMGARSTQRGVTLGVLLGGVRQLVPAQLSDCRVGAGPSRSRARAVALSHVLLGGRRGAGRWRTRHQSRTGVSPASGRWSRGS